MRVKPQATHGVRHGHESKDIRIRWVVLVAVTLIVAAVIIHTGLWWYERAVTPQGVQIVAPPPPVADPGFAPGGVEVPAPRLQVSPPADMAAYRAREEAELHSYGWVDPTAGVVRIPIEHAMDLVAERGLPARTNGAGPSGGKTLLEMLHERRNRALEALEGRR